MAKEEKYEEDKDFEAIEEDISNTDVVKKLRQKLKYCQKESKEYLLGWQRAKADLVNERKLSQKQNAHSSKFAVEGLVHQILPVIDSFEIAFKNSFWEEVDKNWRCGIENIHSQFLSILKENHVEQINPVGKQFDPKYHQLSNHL